MSPMSEDWNPIIGFHGGFGATGFFNSFDKIFMAARESCAFKTSGAQIFPRLLRWFYNAVRCLMAPARDGSHMFEK